MDFKKIWQKLFCSHKHMAFEVVRRAEYDKHFSSVTYLKATCLDCGYTQEFAIDDSVSKENKNLP